MNIEYRICDWCNECISPTGIKEIKFTNLETQYICLVCDRYLKTEDYITVVEEYPPSWSYITEHITTKVRNVYPDWESFSSAITADEILKLGIWKQDDIKTFLRSSFINNQEVSIGMSNKIIRRTLGALNPTDNLYIGFKGHTIDPHEDLIMPVPVYPGLYFLKITRSKYDDPKRVYNLLSNYIVKYKLNRTPMLIASNSSKSRYKPKDLYYFCFPDKNPKIVWFDSLTDLRIARWEWRDDIKWFALPKFFTCQISGYIDQMEKLQKRVIKRQDQRRVTMKELKRYE